MLLPGSSCSFKVTANTAGIGNTVTIQGTNTNSLVVNVTVTPTPFLLSLVGSFDNGMGDTGLSYTSSDGGQNWNGSVTLPPHQGLTLNTLNSVACSSNGLVCASVGYYSPNALRISPFSFTSNDGGVNWAPSSVFPPVQGISSDILNGISCSSNGLQCTAVGQYMVGPVTRPLSYISTDGGVIWVLSTTLPPTQGALSNNLQSVSCDESGLKCVAVGHYNNGSNIIPLSFITTDGGANWLISSTLPPSQGSGNHELHSVSCSSDGLRCAAVGTYTDSVTTPLSYISMNGGITWTVSLSVPTPLSANNNFLNAISCSSDGLRCVSTGYYDNGSGLLPLTYLSANGGNTWTASPSLPSSPYANNLIRSIQCDSTATRCVIAGIYLDALSFTQALTFYTVNGGLSWTISLPPQLGPNGGIIASVGGSK